MSAPLRLKLRPKADGIAIDAEGLLPERLAGLSRGEVERLPIGTGGGRPLLGDLFAVSGDPGESLDLEGDLSGFARLGAGMTRGRLTLVGPAGPCAGSGMCGGELCIEGPASDRAGEGMRGGLLRIRGDAGDQLASPLPGHPHGMNRGAIIVEGSVGTMSATRMRRGTIVIGRDAAPGAACGMLSGTLIVLGRLGEGAGALMRRGTLVALGGARPLPVFLDAGACRHPFLELYYRQIEAAGLALPPTARAARYRRHVGDISDLGQGEILIPEGAE